MDNSNQTRSWVIALVAAFLIIGLWGYKQQSTQGMFDAVYLSEGLQVGSMFKQATAGFYYEQGKFPNSNQDVGLGKPDVYANNGLKRVEIMPKGVIQLTYNAKTGVDDGVVSLIPTVVPGLMKWRCETRDYPNIGKTMPQCNYLPKFDSERVVVEQVKNILPIQHVKNEQGASSYTEKNKPDSQCDSTHKPMLLDGVFTRQIVNSEPVDNLQSLGQRQQELYFYSTVIGGAEQTISHRWLFNNQAVQEQTFTLGFDQFPIWSKHLLDGRKGSWEVQVWAEGCLLERFKIAHSDKDEAQLVGIDPRYSWHKPKDVLDAVIINSAKALIAKDDFKTETWMFNRDDWQQEQQASTTYSDDITNTIRAGEQLSFEEKSHHFNHNRRNISGDTPLLEAIKYGQQKIALTLLKQGANPFIRGADGTRPYQLAVDNNMQDLTAAILHYAESEKLWIESKDKRFHTVIIKDIMTYQKWQQRDALGDTPLLLAARQDNDWAVAALLQFARGSNLNAINPFMNDHLGKRANEIAREKGNLLAADLIEQFQQQSKAPWQILESSISTGIKGDRSFDCVDKQPLAKSATYYYFNHLMDTETDNLRHKWFYQNRLVKEVKPNKGSRKDTLFSAHTLTEIDKGYWYVELVNEQGDVLDRMKLAYGEKYTSGGGTPLSTRCLGAGRSLTSLIAGWQSPKLIAEKMDAMNNFDYFKSRGLATAIEFGNISVVRLLLDRGVNLAALLDHSKPPLFLAVKSGNPIMVDYLLYRGANPNQQGRGFTSALYKAVVEQDHQIIKILLEAGANPSLRTIYLDSLPLIKAANVCDIEAMNLLVQHGARFDQKTKAGGTALDMASRDCRSSKNWQAIKQLVEQESGSN